MKCKYKKITKEVELQQIEDIVASVGSENPNPGEYGGIEKEDGYYLMQHYKEYSEYIHWFLQNDIRKMENTLCIGIGAGGELRCFRDFVDVDYTWFIDNGSYESFPMYEKYNKKELKKQTNLIEIFGDSKDGKMVERINNINKDVKFDLVFVDGWHDREYIINDTNIGLHFAKPGTFFVFHDTEMLQPCKDMCTEISANINFEKVFHSNHKCGLTIFKLLNTGIYL